MTRTARALRSQMTFPESLLWSKLRSAQLGARFRRQHPIGGYVADFYCASAKLVVEIDGRSHDQTADADQARQADLERQGLRVIRYTNDEVLTSLDAVIADIFRHVNDSTLTQPSPCQGEGLEGASIANRQSALGNPPSTLTQPSGFQGEGFDSDLSLEGRGRRVPTPGEGGGAVVEENGFAENDGDTTSNDSTLTQPSGFQGEGLEGASIANRQSALGNPPSTLTQPSPFQGEGFEGAPIGSRHSAIHPQPSLHPFQGEGSDSVSHQRADNS